MTPSTPTATLPRRLAAWLLAAYCVFVVLMGIPRELGPRHLHQLTAPTRDLLDDYGINPWHFVFPGQRGTEKRRNFAVRFTGVTTEGERVVLHEAPPGLTAPAVRVFDDAQTTVSMKIFSLGGLGRVMLERDDQRWSQAMQTLRRRGPVKRGLLGFCTSETLHGGRELRSVELDVFTAGISYETGDQYGRAAHLLEVNCSTEALTPVFGEAPNRPDWPGVEWQAVP